MLRCGHRRMSGVGNVTLGYRELLALFLEGACGFLFLQFLIRVEIYSGLLPRSVYRHLYG